ncbi:MAG: ATP-binding protein [Acidimicrobiaceae bacterium]|nr:ATP-binding protein [Acidimicrobiaceae bacterium]
MAEDQLELDLALVDPTAAVRALRDAQYDNTGKAIAELIDNSIDAKATRVELLIEEQKRLVKKRSRWRVSEIAVVDNGSGMTPTTLVDALRIGGRRSGTRAHPIGKYGMGLPTASASQCLLAEVWTWQESIERAAHSILNVGGILDGHVKTQQIPDVIPVPKKWVDRISEQGLDKQKGTLVVWSDFGDRVLSAAETLFRQVEDEVGRTYRHFINDRSLSIRMARFRDDNLEADNEVRPNDPLYLMSNSSTPTPWHEDPMFKEYDTPRQFAMEVEIRGSDGELRTREEVAEVRFSMVRPEVIINNRDEHGTERGGLPGRYPHGRSAGRNMGVSIVRANRELLLDRSFLPMGGGDQENRWWGCEVLFEPGLDEAFGVDHNKQMATRISNAAKTLINSPKRTDSDAIDDLGIDEDDPVYPVYDMVAHIRRTTRNMLNEIEQLFRQRRQRQNQNQDNAPVSPSQEAARIAKEARQEELRDGATPTETDIERDRTDPGAKKAALTEYFEQGDLDPETADQYASSIVARDDWYAFSQRKLYGHQMFGVDNVNGVLVVSLNINHELFDFLEVLEDQSEDLGDPLARRAAVALRTLLLAWARLQDETAENRDRAELEHIAVQWGKHARHFLPGIAKDMNV